MNLHPGLVMNASNSFRYSRPDMYLGALSYNKPMYISALLGDQSRVNMNYVDPSETVPVMVRNLTGYDRKPLWHNLC